MTNNEILKKAVIIAMDNGYIPAKGEVYFNVEDNEGNVFQEHGQFLHSYETCQLLIKIGMYKNIRLLFIADNYFQVIFSHRFAKAFWGEETIDHMISDDDMTMGDFGEEWEYHLQQMVRDKEPLQYIKDFL